MILIGRDAEIVVASLSRTSGGDPELRPMRNQRGLSFPHEREGKGCRFYYLAFGIRCLPDVGTFFFAILCLVAEGNFLFPA